MLCDLDYIPSHLHTNGRPDINYFEIGENLFRRCKEEHKTDPFNSISLVDLSVNRRGTQGNILCEPDDVFFNTNPDNGKGEKITESIFYLEIKELTDSNEYLKIFYNEIINESGEKIINSCKIHLKHDKTACMYAHCAFKIYLNDVETTYENYKEGLKKNKMLSITCRNELAKMYIKGEVRLNW